MADDPLAAYRRTPLPATPETEAPEVYAAFGTKDRVPRLRIRSSAAPIHAPGYNILLDVVYDAEGTNFMLVYTMLLVLVRGRNLQKAVYAIENGMADFIQAYDANRWAQPADTGAAFIESIEVRIKDEPPPGSADAAAIH